MLALALRLRSLLEFQVGCLTVLKKPTHEISKLLSKTETAIQLPYEMVIKEISNAINQWAQTEISAVNDRLAEIEDLKRYYDYGGAV